MTDTTEAPDATVSQGWECFCCPASYDMWRVRKIGERGFDQGFLVVNQESAEALRDYLANHERELADAVDGFAMAIAEMSRARGRLETIAGCNEDRRIAASLGSTCDYLRSKLAAIRKGEPT